jgi:3-hydroxyisobutyrate dehydrogenase-like beta-hydroxyacid dehydrogenase
LSFQTIGVLHPGAMGVTVAASLKSGGNRVVWASEGRSKTTWERAVQSGLEDVRYLNELIQASEVIISVCPPHAAVDLARTVISSGFKGVYVDVNAVAPATSRRIMQTVLSSEARYVDGGIIGPPAIKRGTSRLYLAGQQAGAIKELFDQGNLEVVVIGNIPGTASALKMCYAAWTKGSSALLLAVRALADAEGVSEALLQEWKLSQPGLKARSEGAAVNSAPKAWRFVGEMEEIASTFKEVNLPDGFHLGAAELYKRLRAFKDRTGIIPVREVIEEINHKSKESSTG